VSSSLGRLPGSLVVYNPTGRSGILYLRNVPSIYDEYDGVEPDVMGFIEPGETMLILGFIFNDGLAGHWLLLLSNKGILGWTAGVSSLRVVS
jgi:hypothetical protein